MSLNPSDLYRAIQNQAGVYSLWPSSLAIPQGWNTTQVEGTQTECLKAIKELWKEDLPPYLVNHSPYTTQPQTLIDEFVAKAKQLGNQIALVTKDGTLTYAELYQKALNLAFILHQNGIKAEACVGVFLDRSADLVISILSILMAGGAYVPLDPHFPPDRLNFMIEDCGLNLILSHSSISPRLVSTQTPILKIDQLEQESSEKLSQFETSRNKLHPENLRYVMYTSGSTGRPKGVEIPDRSLSNFAHSMIEEPGIQEGHIVLGITSANFDISILELLVPLTRGAKIVLAAPTVSSNPDALIPLIEKHSVNFIQATPSTWEMLLDANWQGDQRICALSGGEALSLNLAKRLSQKVGALWNLYGPTETTVWSMIAKIPLNPQIISLGKPIKDTSIYLLDKHLSPVKQGEVGEIYIGGRGVGRGYRKRPDLTASRFIADPFSDVPGSRLYRTGDLARYSESELEYLGREDFQVKIRGHRIELSEIASTLEESGLVQKAVVTVHQGVGGPELICYFKDKIEIQSSTTSSLSDKEAVTQWSEIWDASYQSERQNDDPLCNFSGWINSYTGKPFPNEQMINFFQNTVQRIFEWASLSQKKPKILEVGCGIGLILFRLIEHCLHYTGLDSSEEAIRVIQTSLEKEQFKKYQERIKLQRLEATGIRQLSEKYDLIVINSVVQYFPNSQYLLNFLREAQSLLNPGGLIFLGDIRNLNLIHLFHLTVQVERSDPTASFKEICSTVKGHVEHDPELLVDPLFFFSISKIFPELRLANIELKKGMFHNEMAEFRYDVMLKKEDVQPLNMVVKSLHWNSLGKNRLEFIRTMLARQEFEAMCFEGIPNSRISKMVSLSQLNIDQEISLGQALMSISEGEEEQANPEEFWKLAEEFPYAIHIYPITESQEGKFSVLFLKKPFHLSPGSILALANCEKTTTETFNHPFKANKMQQKVERLFHFLQSKLPSYMIPSHIMAISEFPLTPNGKLDIKALPKPSAVASARNLIPPSNELEHHLFNVCVELFGHRSLSMNDRFLTSGGHSLLAVQLMNKFLRLTGKKLLLSDILSNVTFSELAKIAEVNKTVLSPITSRELPNYPLTSSQESLWFFSQLHPDSSYYNIPIVVRIKGDLNFSALKSALDQIYHRHSSLRTVFEMGRDQTKQRILSNSAAPLECSETNCSETEFKLILQKEASKSFNLTEGPLFKCHLFQRPNKETVLVLNFHHIIFDGISADIFFQDLSAEYNAVDKGEPRREMNESLQFCQYALVQSEKNHQEALLYWSKQLENLPPRMNLPLDYLRPSIQTFQGKRYSLKLPVNSVEAAIQMAHEEGLTPFIIFFSSFAALLHLYSRETDFIIGTPVTLRTEEQFERTIGFFVNMLAMRMDFSKKLNFIELNRQIQKTLMEGIQYDAPFEKVVDHLKLPKNLSQNPIFQISFVLETSEMQHLHLEGLQANPVALDTATSKFDLSCIIHINAQGEHYLNFEYDKALFQPSSIEQMAQSFLTLLNKMLQNPTKPIDSLPLISKMDFLKQLKSWYGKEAAPWDLMSNTFQELFITQAKKTPKKVALVCQGKNINYEELNIASDRVAQELLALDIQKEEFVGILSHRSIEMVIALLGAAKAGAAYIPLDPDAPEERTETIIRDASLRYIIGDSQFTPNLAQNSKLKIHFISLPIATPQSKTLPLPKYSPTQVTYAIYTSGTSGPPKGAKALNRSIINLFHFLEKINPQVTKIQSVTLNAPLIFDASVQQIVRLLSGMTVHIIPTEVRRDPELLSQTLTENQIDLLDCTPSQVKLLLECPSFGKGGFPKMVLVGGEAISTTLWREMAERIEIEFWNVYGPTECAVDSTFVRIGSEYPLPVIGKPIPGTRIYILDEAGNPLPPGCLGEIYISGMGVGQGYIGRPDLTATCFLPDPWSKRTDAKIYKSGDLGRYRPDGVIEYLGRKDNQVKIRGYRIELGEVEQAILSYVGIKDAFVIKYEPIPLNFSLAAYYIPQKQTTINATQLLAFLKKRLPNYMIPSYLTSLIEIPLTKNGKVDIRSLPSPVPIQESQNVYVAPQTVKEKSICQVFEEVLHKTKIGVHDNFFSLGGNSILAALVCMKLSKILSVKIPVRTLFEAPTPDEFSKISLNRSVLSDISKAPEMPDYPITPRMSLSLERMNRFKNSKARNLSMAFLCQGQINHNAMNLALNEVIKKHEILRTSIIETGFGPRLRPNAWKKVDWTRAKGHDFESKSLVKIAQQLTDIEFNFAEGNFLKAFQVEISPDQNLLVLLTHHIVGDAISCQIIKRDLFAAYEHFNSGKKMQEDPDSLQFKDFSFWLDTNIVAKNDNLQRKYWIDRLSQHLIAMPIPYDHGGVTPPNYSANVSQILFEGTQLQAINQFRSAHSISSFMFFSAALNLALATWMRTDNITVGVQVSGRNHPSLNRLVGYFINMVLWNTPVDREKPILEYIQGIKKDLLEVYDNQEYPDALAFKDLNIQIPINLFYNFIQTEQTINLKNDGSMEIQDLNLEEEPEQLTTYFDIEFEALEMEQRMQINMIYRKSLFDKMTMDKLVLQIKQVVDTFLSQPLQDLSSIPNIINSKH